MTETESELVNVRVSKARKEALEQLVEEGQFRSIAEAVNTGLTLLLNQYGRLGVRPVVQARPQRANGEA